MTCIQPSDWYSITKNSIKAKGLWKYYSSLEEALRDLYPEYPWDPSRFALKQRNEKDSLLQLLKETEQQLGINQVKFTLHPNRFSSHTLHPLSACIQPSDWYSITKNSIKAKELWKYYSSLEGALRALYPEYPWDPSQFAWKRRRVRNGYDSLLQLLITAEQQLEIKQVSILQKAVLSLSCAYCCFVNQASDWYSITLADLKNIGAPSKLSKVELAEALQERYPDFKWEKVFLLRGRFGQQRRLQHLLTELFPVIMQPFFNSFLFSSVCVFMHLFRERRCW